MINNTILEKVLKQLLDQSNRIAYFVLKAGGQGHAGSEVHIDEHEVLFASLSSGDAEEAAQRFQAHVRESEQRVIDSLLKSRHFSDLPIRIEDGVGDG